MLAFLASAWRSLATIILIERREVDFGCPAETLAGLGGVADEQIDLGGAEELGVLAHEALPVVDADLGERPLDELTHRVRLAGGDDIVLRFVLLQHQPHRPHVIAGESPVAFGVERPHHQLVLQPELDPRRRVGDLARHELDPPPRPLVIEQDPRTREQPVTLPVVDGDVVTEHLGAAIRRTRMERRQLVLRRLAHLAEHLRRRRLIEADRIVLRPPDHADRLQHPQHPQPRRVRRQLGLREAQRDERDRPQVVHLVRLRQLQRRHQRRQIGQITRHQLDERHLLDDLGRLRVVLPLDHPVHVVTTIMQELGEMTTVLTSNPSNERSRHGRRVYGETFIAFPGHAGRLWPLVR